ncbi:MAG: class I SAM-dependent methyltransferase [Bacteroidetes bacterium]|nr:class I SAM-dependent methyltransferase [Bacteroidota bacterium]
MAQQNENIFTRMKNLLSPNTHQVVSSHSSNVGAFYDSTTTKFMEVYGEVIQAFRTTDVKIYLDYTIENAELKDGQKILDAGCGVGGPASYFAEKLNVQVEGITVSEFQVQISKEIIASKKMKGTVHIQQGDYHRIDEIFGTEIFDRVIFLESFGHSDNKPLLIEKAFKVLKPGGILYIKDLFKREHPNEEDGKKIDRIVNEINKAYCYHVADLHEVLAAMRRLNFILLFVKTPEVKVGEFEHLTISNDFQNLFDIAKIISWEDYIFPIDFYEIKVMKPPFDMSKEKHLYFLNRPEAVSQVKTE